MRVFAKAALDAVLEEDSQRALRPVEPVRLLRPLPTTAEADKANGASSGPHSM
jgi:hypothetical protein